jgi:hypothetical protein
MEKMHDTFADLAAGTPWWFTLSARALPIGLFGQFLSAGTALFRDAEMWGLHGAVGGMLAIPALVLAVGAVCVGRLRGFGWWAGLTLALYVIQIALAAGANPLPLSLHPFNGALLLTASLILLAKVERRRAQPQLPLRLDR